MTRIVSEDEYADKDLWASLIDPAFQAAQDMEADLIKQVSEMTTEIAGDLKLSLKEAYSYLKKVKELQG